MAKASLFCTLLLLASVTAFLPNGEAFLATGETSLEEVQKELPELQIQVADQKGGLTFTNLMDVGGGVQVAIHCRNSVNNVPPTYISKGQPYSFTFMFDRAVNDPYQCTFLWIDGTNTQTFDAWTHDGVTPYLSTCDKCSWNIMNDGFYILDSTKNVYTKLYPWVTAE